MSTAVRIVSDNRWDALELMDALLPYHPYLVQKSRAWELYGYTDRDAPEIETDLQERVAGALRKRRLTQTEIVLDDERRLLVSVDV